MGEIHKNLEEDQIEYRSEYSKTIMYFVTKRIIAVSYTHLTLPTN